MQNPSEFSSNVQLFSVALEELDDKAREEDIEDAIEDVLLELLFRVEFELLVLELELNTLELTELELFIALLADDTEACAALPWHQPVAQ